MEYKYSTDLIKYEFILVEWDAKVLKLSKSEQYVSEKTGKQINTVSKRNASIRARFESNSQPLYVCWVQKENYWCRQVVLYMTSTNMKLF